jgi:hypothetical protein
MRGALDTVARLGMGDENATAWDVPCHRLHFQHTQALRGALAEKYAHTTANRILSARRGVLRAAWKLGPMPAEDYQKAASVESVRGETVPAGLSAMEKDECHSPVQSYRSLACRSNSATNPVQPVW